jgi:FtsZ-interacting cell division protein ZipA
MLDTVLVVVSIIASVLGLIVAVWSYIDTRRRYSRDEHIEQIQKRLEDAEKRFKKKSRFSDND